MTQARLIPRQAGFALLLALAIMTLASLYVAVDLLGRESQELARDEVTVQALAQAREALIGYAVTYRDSHPDEVFGYLPCPDTADKSGLFVRGDGSAAGSCGSAGQPAIGLLPYRTLGLPDLRDGAGNCLWYAVSGSHKNSPKGSQAGTLLPLNWDTQGQLAVRESGGLALVAPEDAQGGAVAVIFAPGAPLAGQARTSLTTPCTVDPGQLRAYLESVGGLPLQSGSVFTQGRRDGNDNNDRLEWISARQLFDRIKSRADFHNPSSASPVGQINRLLDETSGALEKLMQDDLLAHGATPLLAQPSASIAQLSYATAYQQFPGKLLGDPPAGVTVNDARYRSYYTNWHDHLRYGVCSNLATGCFSVADEAGCRGILLFGGERSGGGPRRSGEKTPTAGLPVTSALLSNYLTGYFESAGGSGGLDVLTTAGTAFSGAIRYADERRAADVGRCLFPGAFIALEQDIARFSANVSNAAYPSAGIDVSGHTLSLGHPAAVATAGCLWYAQPVALNSRLRAYFRFSVAQRGEGFVFTVADADPKRNGQPPGCGGSGGSLGYAGGGVHEPKIGLEIDMRSAQAQNDPAASHFAFVYWGTSTNPADDNAHAAGRRGSGSEPYNPRSLTGDTGISSVKTSDANLPYAGSLPLNTDIHVRLDLIRVYPSAPGRGQYRLQAYVATKFDACSLTDFRNLAQDLTELCEQKAKISDVIDIADLPGLGPAMANAYIGFTSGQSANSPQQIAIGDLLVRSF